MSKHESLKPHIYLFDLMAEKTGHHLEEAIVDGEITPEEILDAVFRCSGCEQAHACAAELPHAEKLKAPFDYCQNQSLFRRLDTSKS